MVGSVAIIAYTLSRHSYFREARGFSHLLVNASSPEDGSLGEMRRMMKLWVEPGCQNSIGGAVVAVVVVVVLVVAVVVVVVVVCEAKLKWQHEASRRCTRTAGC